MSMQPERRYWFKAKRYGWGWGSPLTWEGWVVLAVYIAAIAAGPFMFPPRIDHTMFLSYTFGLTAVMLVICWATGEPPGRR
jgi:hypothetical protein